MTHASCPDCRLRFTPAAAAYLPGCPSCGHPLQRLDRLELAVGFRLAVPDDGYHRVPDAVEVAMPPPDPHLR